MIMVFICHTPIVPSIKNFRDYYKISGVFTDIGAIPVSIFFIISGLVMAHNHKNATKRGLLFHLYSFWIRLAKFYPLALLITIIGIPFALLGSLSDRVNWFSVPINLLLLQSYFPLSNFSGVCWFLSTLCFAYLFFPLLLNLINTLGKTYSLLFIFIMYLIPFFFSPFFYSDFLYTFFYSFPLYRVYEFLLGIYIAIYLLPYGKTKSHNIDILIFTSFLLIFCIVILKTQFPFLYMIVATKTMFTPFTAFVVYLLAITRKGLFYNLSQHKIIVFLSSISLPFFLLHQISLRTLRFVLLFFNLQEHCLINIIAIIVLFFFLILFCYLYKTHISAFFQEKMLAINPFNRKGKS